MLKKFDYFKQGNCVVHHMFDESVTQRLRKYHADAHLTAHLEVPGGMFDMSLEAKAQGRGQVGSTADILHYIIDTVQAEVDTASAAPVRLPFVLGTEAGMITGIVNKVQEVLRTHNSAVEAEIIFPVSSAAITAAPDSELGVVPGVASGEGCSTAGGCATCPFMKMNTLDALFDVVELCGNAKDSHQLTLDLAKFKVLERASKMASAEVDSAQLGVVPINHMRAFQNTKRLPDELVHDIAARASHLAASAALAANPEVLARV
jgi:quinolinate synthase